MRLALLSPVHGTSIDHIARQLDNYRIFLAPFQLRHYLHISLESSSELKANLMAFAEQEGHDIVITKKSRPTWRPCTANALCELIKTALQDDAKHDKVLIHTDTDLLFTSNVKDHLKKHSIGCGNKPFRGKTGRWKWVKKAQKDPRVKSLTEEMLDGDPSLLRIGRVSGAFMPWDRFKSFGVIYNHYFDNRFFEQHPKRHWPLPEIAIPTILHLLEGSKPKFQPALIRAPDSNKITTKIIDYGLKSGDYFGLKKVSRDTDSEAFQYLNYLQSEAAKYL
jgi:hypothetical protein